MSDFVGRMPAWRKDGSMIWIDCKTTLMRSHEEKSIGYLGIARNMTDQKNIEDNLHFLSSAKDMNP